MTTDSPRAKCSVNQIVKQIYMHPYFNHNFVLVAPSLDYLAVVLARIGPRLTLQCSNESNSVNRKERNIDILKVKLIY